MEWSAMLSGDSASGHVIELGLMAVTGGLLFLLAWVAMKTFPQSSASTRHVVWLLALVSPLLLPLGAWLPPHWRADLGSLIPARTDRMPARTDSFREPRTIDLRQASPVGLGEPDSVDPASPPQAFVPIQPPFATSQSVALPIEGSKSSANFPWNGLLSIWMVGVIATISTWIAGRISLFRLGRAPTSDEFDRLAGLLDSARAELRVSRPVQLLLSSRRRSPMQWGILRPVILLPCSATPWSRQRVRSVLLHELAHVARGDCATRAVAHLAVSVLWFSPLSWLAYRRVARECELSSDDLALRSGCDPCDYAETLIDVCRAAPRRPSLWVPALGMASPSTLEGRVRSILSPRKNRNTACKRATLLATSTTLLLVGAAAAVQPAPVQASSEKAITEAATAEPVSDEEPRPVNGFTADSRVVTHSHVDDSAEGKRSLAGSGHAVRFELPEGQTDARHLLAVEIYANRYGYPEAPAEDFHVYVLDENQKLIAAFPVPYKTIARGRERWYTLPIAATKVSGVFHVALAFNPHRTKGIYVGYDESDPESHSYVGRPTSGLTPWDKPANWMIRAVTSAAVSPANPFESPVSDLPPN